MKKLQSFFTKTENITRSAYSWNIIACTSSSFQSMLLLLIISRCAQTDDAAIFTIAYSIGSLLLFVGKYGVRNFQVSDINHEFSFEEYKQNRIITTIIMGIGGCAYILWGYFAKDYNVYKCLCMLALLCPRIIESLEDVLHGHFHQNGRLDVSAKIWGLRTILYIVSFCAAYECTQDLLITSTVALIITLILCILFNYSVKDLFERDKHYSRNSIQTILKKCFPLALSTTLMAYIANAPKYAVDGVVNIQEQASFSVIFMPVFVITLLGNYIFNPMIGRLTVMWEEKDTSRFFNTILKIAGIICAITLLVIVGGVTIGIILLELLYKVELSSYLPHLGILIFAGGLLAILNFAIIIATILRQQKLIQTVVIIGTLLWLAGSKYILINISLLGLIIYFAIVLILILLMAGISLFRHIKIGGTAND